VATRRQNRELEIATRIAQLIALLVLAGVFLTQVGQKLFGFGVMLIGAGLLVGVVAFGVYLIRRTERKSFFDRTPDTQLETTTPQPTLAGDSKPQTPVALIE
jgi:hypothetical protein